jgi:hypothetical protein
MIMNAKQPASRRKALIEDEADGFFPVVQYIIKLSRAMREQKNESVAPIHRVEVSPLPVVIIVKGDAPISTRRSKRREERKRMKEIRKASPTQPTQPSSYRSTARMMMRRAAEGRRLSCVPEGDDEDKDVSTRKGKAAKKDPLDVQVTVCVNNDKDEGQDDSDKNMITSRTSNVEDENEIVDKGEVVAASRVEGDAKEGEVAGNRKNDDGDKNAGKDKDTITVTVDATVEEGTGGDKVETETV